MPRDLLPYELEDREGMELLFNSKDGRHTIFVTVRKTKSGLTICYVAGNRSFDVRSGELVRDKGIYYIKVGFLYIIVGFRKKKARQGPQKGTGLGGRDGVEVHEGRYQLTF